jgi:uncharacterized membrane protein
VAGRGQARIALPDRDGSIHREAAGRHFNRGQRTFFFALGYLGWFIGPLALMLTTVLVLVALWRRQFGSDALRAITTEAVPPRP